VKEIHNLASITAETILEIIASESAFQAEFERIVQELSDDLADFTGLVFPSSDYSHRTFSVKCCFDRATFVRDTWFSWTKFTHGADSLGAKFMGRANLFITEFMRAADSKWRHSCSTSSSSPLPSQQPPTFLVDGSRHELHWLQLLRGSLISELPGFGISLTLVSGSRNSRQTA
jgi:hypothetical protein